VRGGRLVLCAGALGSRYQELSGFVRYVGKPHSQVYRRCFEVLGISAPKRILAIGDSLVTDVAGAAALGMDTIFVTGGLYAAELGVAPETPPEPARLAALYAQAGVAPMAAMPLFAW
ncbi:MAG TPA: HAD hydrolase-like protein, partial [Alphaproteobacteria bacterium]|nr:HAD hydrolase-like protein [Alphaproteobacteria bacterium]